MRRLSNLTVADVLQFEGAVNVMAGAQIVSTKEAVLDAGAQLTLGAGASLTSAGLHVASGTATVQFQGGLLDVGASASAQVAGGATLVLSGTGRVKGTISTSLGAVVEFFGATTVDSSTQIKGDGVVTVKGAIVTAGVAPVTLGEAGKTTLTLTRNASIEASAPVYVAARVTIDSLASANVSTHFKGGAGVTFQGGVDVAAAKFSIDAASSVTIGDGYFACMAGTSAIVGTGTFVVAATLRVQAVALLKAGSQVTVGAGAEATIGSGSCEAIDGMAKAVFNLTGGAVLSLAGPFVLDGAACEVQGDGTVVFNSSSAAAVCDGATITAKTIDVKSKLQLKNAVALQAAVKLDGNAQVTAESTVVIDEDISVNGAAVLAIAANGRLEAKKALTIDGGAQLQLKDGANATAESTSCGTAATSSKSQLVLGDASMLTVSKSITLNAANCDVKGATASIVLAGTVDAESSISAGTYAVQSIACEGKSNVKATGDVVLSGALTLKGDAKVEAQGKLETTAALDVQGNAHLQSSGSASIKSAEAKFAATATFTAKFLKAAADSSAALEASGSATFAGTLEIATFAAIKSGDKFVIANYGACTGEFANVKLSGSAGGRKRHGDEEHLWKVEYGAQQATATYTGHDVTAVPTSTGKTDSSNSAAVRSFVAAALVVPAVVLLL